MKNISKSHRLLKGKDGVSFLLYEETVVYVLGYPDSKQVICAVRNLIQILHWSPYVFHLLRLTYSE